MVQIMYYDNTAAKMLIRNTRSGEIKMRQDKTDLVISTSCAAETTT